MEGAETKLKVIARLIEKLCSSHGYDYASITLFKGVLVANLGTNASGEIDTYIGYIKNETPAVGAARESG